MPAMMLRKKMNHMIAYWPARTYFRQLTNEGIGTRQVAARPGQTGDKTELDRVFGDVEDDGDSGGYGLGRQRRRGIGGDDHDDLSPNQFGRQRREPVKPTFGPAVVDRHVLALDIARLFEALAKGTQALGNRFGRSDFEKSDHRHRRLLRARRERPRGRCTAAEQDDEFAPSYA